MNPAAEARLLLEQLTAIGTSERARRERAYLKSSLQFVGSGVPGMRQVVKTWLRANPSLTHDELFAVADALWQHPVHECRVAATELLVQRPTLVAADDLPWIERTLRDCHTWALVDPVAGWVTAELAVRDPDGVVPTLDRWLLDSDFWVRRSAVLALRALLRRDEQLPRFFHYAETLLPETEFFIRKVIGWVMREVAARHPDEVSNWLRTHMDEMNLITLREPLRKLPDAEELRALYDNRRKSAG